MSEDLRIAYEMEALLVMQHGLLIPRLCDCRFEVLASYPGRPWYFVRLACQHTLRKMPPNLGRPEREALAPRVCAWMTGMGEPVPIVLLQRAYEELCSADREDLDALGASITRSGGVYYLEDDVLRYDEPEDERSLEKLRWNQT